MSQQTLFDFDNSYVNLSPKLFSNQSPTPVSNPSMIALNHTLVEQLGLNTSDFQTDEGLAVLSGNRIPSGAEPIATAYAGHQFGNWVPQLGDGRAVLLGEIVNKEGTRYDIQLKGAGPTPYSRNGDGRAAVGPVVREYVVSEAMAALGVPTTRALAAVSTGDTVRRETLLPGAILTRVASSHIRVGTFQFFAARRDTETIKLLTDHVISRHYPQLRDASNPPLALLAETLKQQVELIAHWQSIGFIHGVMNTDNASVAGITIDYGPCAFMDTYHPSTVFSSIDHASRYAYQNQPSIAQWNMANLAQCLLAIIDEDEDKALQAAQDVIDSFPALFSESYLSRFRHKLGLSTEQENDEKLIADFLVLMQESHMDFTNTFRQLSTQMDDVQANTLQAQNNTDSFFEKSETQQWISRWHARMQRDNNSTEARVEIMHQNNPAYIPRNHKVEQIIAAATEQNYKPMEQMLSVLSNPYKEQPNMQAYAQAPNEDEIVRATFCGT